MWAAASAQGAETGWDLVTCTPYPRSPVAIRAEASNRKRPGADSLGPFCHLGDSAGMVRCRLSLQPRARRRLRNLLDHLADGLLLRTSRNVRLCQDADQPVVLIDDRKSPHLLACHQLESLREVIVRVDGDEFTARNLAHRHPSRVLPFGYRSDDDVSVRDHAGQLLSLENGE